MIRQIPKKLLIHSVIQQYGRTTNDEWQSEAFAGSRSISYVRVEPSTAIVKSKDNKEVQLKSTLFYDCQNSSPAGLAFAIDEIVTFDGLDYRVASFEKFYDNQRLHHWEVGLI